MVLSQQISGTQSFPFTRSQQKSTCLWRFSFIIVVMIYIFRVEKGRHMTCETFGPFAFIYFSTDLGQHDESPFIRALGLCFGGSELSHLHGFNTTYFRDSKLFIMAVSQCFRSWWALLWYPHPTYVLYVFATGTEIEENLSSLCAWKLCSVQRPIVMGLDIMQTVFKQVCKSPPEPATYTPSKGPK